MKKVILFISLLIFGGLIFMAYSNLSTLKKGMQIANKCAAANTTCYSGVTDHYFYKDIVVNFLRH